MLTLILMRHAKSSWDDPVLTDFDRPLNARGKRSALALGQWLASENLEPDQVISSSSARTRETYLRLNMKATPTFTRDLYHAAPSDIWRVVHSASGTRVLLIGHNPGVSDFAENVVFSPPSDPRFWDYPTGATLVVTFDATRWELVRQGTGKVIHFVTPRQLLE